MFLRISPISHLAHFITSRLAPTVWHETATTNLTSLLNMRCRIQLEMPPQEFDKFTHQKGP